MVDHGEPTGMLKEDAMDLVSRVRPEITPTQRQRGIELALEDAARNGVTSAQDNSAWEDFLVYEQLKKEGKLTLRITEWLPFTAPLSRLEEMRRYGGTTDLRLRTGALATGGPPADGVPASGEAARWFMMHGLGCVRSPRGSGKRCG